MSGQTAIVCEEQHIEWLKGQGIEYVGDYPEVPTEQQRAIKLARLQEMLTRAESAEGVRNGAKRVTIINEWIAKEFPDEP